MNAPLPPEILQKLLKCLDDLSMAAGKAFQTGKGLNEDDINTLLWSVNLTSDTSARDELRLWVHTLESAFSDTKVENREIAISRLVKRGIGEREAIASLVRIVRYGGGESDGDIVVDSHCKITGVRAGETARGTVEIKSERGGYVITRPRLFRVAPDKFGAGTTKLTIEIDPPNKPLQGAIEQLVVFANASSWANLMVSAQWSPVDDEAPGAQDDEAISGSLYLRCTYGRQIDKLYPLNEGKILIGRKTETGKKNWPDIDLGPQEDSSEFFTVSRRHLEVGFKEGNCTITDLGSLNGSMINETSLESGKAYPLKPGDELSIGLLKFNVETEE
jgi:FHA domain-containing protein